MYDHIHAINCKCNREVICSRGALYKFNQDFPPKPKSDEDTSISSRTRKSSPSRTTSTTGRLSYVIIVKNVDNAPLLKSIVILKEEINRDIQKVFEEQEPQEQQRISH